MNTSVITEEGGEYSLYAERYEDYDDSEIVEENLEVHVVVNSSHKAFRAINMQVDAYFLRHQLSFNINGLLEKISRNT